ncbi:MAG: NAD-dependent epimerase/dehydratase family protein [Acidobacteria bacterium]|nr:NAD-dependent epimerase/dehydratase family protein [Acidobacteriota bacterium]
MSGSGLTLVTGASGFIGGHVARTLAGRGERLRLLLRPSSDRRGLAGLDFEEALGDLRDPSSLESAVRGCSTVYHVAADYRLWSRDPRELERSNVEGTRNLLQACERAGVEKVVYTSTVGAIGIVGDGTLGDETSPVSLADMTGPYKRTKFLAEKEALDAARRGLPVVIVNPTAPVGEADLKPTPTGKIIVDFLRGAMPAYLDTGLNLVDVRDVAQGHLRAADRGEPGERYILGCRNMSLREILESLATITGRPAPGVRIPYVVAWLFGAGETVLAGLTGREPRAPLEAVRMARKKMYVRSEKAERELDWRPGPPEAALERAVAWFRANGYC